ncbi:MAG: hypothetical protein ACOH2H_18720 [Cypionkella sp.]
MTMQFATVNPTIHPLHARKTAFRSLLSAAEPRPIDGRMRS